MSRAARAATLAARAPAFAAALALAAVMAGPAHARELPPGIEPVELGASAALAGSALVGAVDVVAIARQRRAGSWALAGFLLAATDVGAGWYLLERGGESGAAWATIGAGVLTAALSLGNALQPDAGAGDAAAAVVVLPSPAGVAAAGRF